MFVNALYPHPCAICMFGEQKPVEGIEIPKTAVKSNYDPSMGADLMLITVESSAAPNQNCRLLTQRSK